MFFALIGSAQFINISDQPKPHQHKQLWTESHIKKLHHFAVDRMCGKLQDVGFNWKSPLFPFKAENKPLRGF